MKHVREGRARRWSAAMACALAALAMAVPARAQLPTAPSTLRYGSGLLDTPVSSVLPHLWTTLTLSGFSSDIGRRALVDASGLPGGYGPGRAEFFTDASLAVGLFDRFETGITVQGMDAADSGGNLWGVFGRIRLWEPVDQGIGFAVGGRYLSSPTFDDGADYAPGRLGFADDRLRADYGSLRGIDSNLSLYAVATAYLRGFDGGPLPPNDLILSLGRGSGLFSEGGELAFYGDGHSNGWFGGAALQMEVGAGRRLTLMTEHNGFDVNVGGQFDWDGIRVGAHYLASNHAWPTEGHTSEYAKPKFGVLLSIAVCPEAPGWRCRPRGLERVEPDTIYMPPPPPDTVLIVRGGEDSGPLPGAESSLCLSTGQNVPIWLSPAGDTLVGPRAVSLRSLGPAVSWAGAYAGSAFWYQDAAALVFEGGSFTPSEDTFPIDCRQILRVGVHEGVPIFAVIDASRPFQVLFVPVRPGLWHRYERQR